MRVALGKLLKQVQNLLSTGMLSLWITGSAAVSLRYRRSMRWDDLFDDLEGQLEYGLGAEAIDLKAEEERLRLGQMSLRDRLTSIARAQAKGSSYAISVQLVSGAVIFVRPTTFGKDWLAADLAGEARAAAQCVIPMAAVAGLILTPEQVHESLDAEPGPRGAPRLADRIGLAFVLRDLCRRRTSVELVTAAGSLGGTIDRVGREHLDLAVHEPGSARRESNVTQYRVVPLASILLVLL
ncbi:MAG: hypothetical protein QOD05_507 [Microbacteriaceae bacterium]|nr:hypothetical protein [Microbacteriaceae bacterium]